MFDLRQTQNDFLCNKEGVHFWNYSPHVGCVIDFACYGIKVIATQTKINTYCRENLSKNIRTSGS